MTFQSREEFETFLENSGWRNIPTHSLIPSKEINHWYKKDPNIQPSRRVVDMEPVQLCITVYFPPSAKQVLIGMGITAENQDGEWTKIETYTVNLSSLNPERVERHLNALAAAWKALNDTVIAEGTRISGSQAWFEYHCLESMESDDADLWLKSHQQVTILGRGETNDMADPRPVREQNGTPLFYKIRFPDGSTGCVFEDELVDAPSEFQRPAPPKTPKKS